jgi:hypothetical protein
MIVLIDVHVHLYECFDLQIFFDSAFANFQKELTKVKKNCAESKLILVLTDWAKQNWFHYLVELTDSDDSENISPIKNWSFHRTKETISLYAGRQNGQGLFVIAGRKIITSENLEVLALGADNHFDDGVPLKEVIQTIKESGAIPVIPWAVGKWMGKRGKVIKKLLDETIGQDFFLCDNGNRPYFWPRPTYLKMSEKKGMRVLSGSDPLHFASETHRVGSFAFSIQGTISSEFPARDLKQKIQDPKTEIRTYGELEKSFRFFRNQIAMQILKRKSGRYLERK